jgi:ferrochelatase
VNDAINTAADAGIKGVIIVPIGFVSDHVEVIWDLDNEAKETAEERDLKFARVVTSGVAPEFVDGIADLILERQAGASKKALSNLGPWVDACAVGCCPNLRKELPVVAEAR